jgi:DNA-binding winged helix-turn-helix (wHTH) protein/Tfp pilus assembly protein PilF
MLRSAVFHGVIDLASEAAFSLGDLHVDPARLTVSREDRSATVEPRVMMVLLVLAQSGGRVVSRSELLDRCWDGRVVGDNAVQRVISRIRHLAGTLGGFEVETIPKVGYLFRPLAAEPGVDLAPANEPGTAADAPAAEAPAVETAAPHVPRDVPAAASPRTPLVSRRRLFGLGGALLVAGAAGLFVGRLRASDDADAGLAQRLIGKAREAALGTQRESNAQAIAYLRRATELDPSSAEAWGELALAYQHRMEQSMDADLPALAEWARAAATRALAIDPECATAKVALASLLPNFRRWAANERALRDLQRSIPQHPALETAVGWLLCDVGRWTEAIACFRRALAFEPFHPLNQLILGWALWGGGRLEEVDRLLESALRLWPQDRAIWQSRFDFLALTGRTAPALALLDDAGSQPVISPDQDPVPRAELRDFVLTLQSGAATDVDRTVAQLIAVRGSLGTYTVVPYLCALGRLDDAFGLLQTYFFGSATVPPPSPLSRRKAAILFLARCAPMRTDPRFGQLTRRLGLDDYWRETGTRPDAGLVGLPRA